MGHFGSFRSHAGTATLPGTSRITVVSTGTSSLAENNRPPILIDNFSDHEECYLDEQWMLWWHNKVETHMFMLQFEFNKYVLLLISLRK